MADVKPADPAATPDMWSGLAPFIQAAFNMNQANATQQQAQQQRVNALTSSMKPPGVHPGQVQMPNIAAGPMQPPQQVIPNTLPPPLQAAVPGPISMPSSSTPQTPLTQPGLPSQVNHFVTGTPNPMGTRAI